MGSFAFCLPHVKLAIWTANCEYKRSCASPIIAAGPSERHWFLTRADSKEVSFWKSGCGLAMGRDYFVPGFCSCLQDFQVCCLVCCAFWHACCFQVKSSCQSADSQSKRWAPCILQLFHVAMVRCFFTCSEFVGHLNPTLPVVKALVESGHEVHF